MKKKLVLLACLFTLFSTSLFALDYKFDMALRGNLGLMDTAFFKTMVGEENALRVVNYGFTINMDTIFVLESPKVYGLALGVVLGFNQFDQQLKAGTYISEEEVSSSSGSDYAQPSVPMQAINAGLMFRFFPANSLSLGVGALFHFVVNQGSYMWEYGDFDADETILMSGLLGSIIPEIALELTSTRFFGNFGIDFSVNTGLLLYRGLNDNTALIFNAGASFGFRYRFNPY